MLRGIIQVALLVDDYDRAIAFFVGKLEFRLLEDTRLNEHKRWVVVEAPGAAGTRLVLARADSDRQQRAIGDQTGGRVFMFLETDDFWTDYHSLTARGVEFVREPTRQVWGTVAVFRDLYGNLWDLIDRSAGEPSSPNV